MRVDSFQFLPRSFRPLYENPPRLAGEDEPVWTPFDTRLADARIGLVTSAGLFVKATQQPYDSDGERANPTWGDPTWRAIPTAVESAELGMTHLHVNNADVLADHDIALPTHVLAELVADGVVGSSTAEHASVMGFQEAGLDVWRSRTAPEIAARLRDHGADGVVLAPV